MLIRDGDGRGGGRGEGGERVTAARRRAPTDPEARGPPPEHWKCSNARYTVARLCQFARAPVCACSFVVVF